MRKLVVHRSGADVYVGTWCGGGPYSRESGYYPTREAAAAPLASGAYRASLTLPSARARKTGP